MSGLVATIKDRCQRCFGCVRNCPARAIKVEDGQAKVIDERCIGCGNCVKICTQSAKEIQSGIEPVRLLLRSGQHVVAALAPSFPVAFHPTRPGQVVSAARRLGFAEVVEVAFGAELTAREYSRLAASGRFPTLITTACPAAVSYVEKYEPSLVPYLAPVVSPMVATGRAIKTRYRPEADTKVVFIGPCIAKKAEMVRPEVAGAIDAVLTFREFRMMLGEECIDPDALPESRFDGPVPGTARIFPLSGGLLQSAALDEDLIQNQIVVTHGRVSAMQLLRELATGETSARFVDILFCEGCIDGPRIENRQGLYARRDILASYVRAESTPEELARARAALEEYADVDLSCTHSPRPVVLPQPSEEEIAEALRRVNKTRPEDELNCGACGYNTCREKAIAVCQGLAESEMCLPYLIDQMERNYRRLEGLHRQLQDAQVQLIQSEKLASMGQLAAGIAHEINNPLGTILLYSHLMLEQVPAGDERARKLKLVADEASRCRDIVSGLLRFARQNKLTLEKVSLNALLAADLELLRQQPMFKGIEVQLNLDPNLPVIEADPSQLKDVFRNIVVNAAEAMPRGGRLTVTTAEIGNGSMVEVRITDTGCGIPKENLSRIFQPFFTTKQMSEGTGLGLAIAYGIVKMHRGQIEAESEVGRGTTFRVALPVHLSAGQEWTLDADG